ncbi:dihydrofolate reductase [Candidatus Uhrbacteria bacterium]|nr:dihydrofolate reductase [Candidatus Uhrbacteria bacterium]
MAVTINGLIAKKDDSTPFVSPVESKSYCEMVKKTGAMIIGRRTYEILSKQPEFQEFEQVKIVVVSRTKFQTLRPSDLVAETPEKALSLVRDFKQVVVAGGGILNAAFMDQDLIDEIYLDVEPAVVGSGIPLFAGGDFDRKLKLLEVNKLSDDEVQLHYKVIK